MIKNNLPDKEIWHARTKRFINRAALKYNDFNRFVAWNMGGGRWYFNRYYNEIVSAHKWCFIVACNNSGTSLLHSILNRTGKISTMPFEGQRYTTTLTRARKRGYERVWSEYLSELRLTAEHSLDCVPRLIHDWMGEFNLPIQDIIVEKTTANAVRMLWLQEAFPNSYFIGLFRNGYAVSEGICRKGQKSVERAARHWNIVNKYLVNDSKLVKNYLQLSYEELVTKPEETAEKIAKFLGLNYSDIYDSMAQEYDFVTIHGKSHQSIKNFNTDSINRLSSKDINIIQKEASEMLNYFDYNLI